MLPLVRTKLTGPLRDRLEEKMVRFDQKRESSGEVRLLLELGEDLAARYALTKRESSVSP